ncbi:MAG: hypothetical protein R2881_00090 [Eubacteriales bacterium]
MMRHAKEFRDTAWNTLRGKYWWAVLAALIAPSCSAAQRGSLRSGFRYDLNMSHIPQQIQELFQGHFQPEIFTAVIRPFAGVAAAIGSFSFRL